jgi:hypothetical protein
LGLKDGLRLATTSHAANQIQRIFCSRPEWLLREKYLPQRRRSSQSGSLNAREAARCPLSAQPSAKTDAGNPQVN